MKTSNVDVYRVLVKVKELNEARPVVNSLAEDLQSKLPALVMENPHYEQIQKEALDIKHGDLLLGDLKLKMGYDIHRFYDKGPEKLINFYVLSSPKARIKYNRKTNGLWGKIVKSQIEKKAKKMSKKLDKFVKNTDHSHPHYNDEAQLVYLNEKNKRWDLFMARFLRGLNVDVNLLKKES